ncbi:dsDNA-specific endonuclease/ATPase MutS2 [Peribacillus deserti]|uniref:DsDNA-specific endonuclease/ATPase MutS2 n=1 Tax=Peribacillus deserti TaxID=673318 RepID=A0ABS2QHP0_9BACI|nr:hypothetical protein [Peribacillus deserti]MBM7692239.1 dsDNA-specific endonuclease/ATPase MutS2 [Peribacillus deserti]
MSLKAIEMQIALPRTQEAGKIQEQLQQRGQLQNDLASLEMHKEDKRKTSTVTRKNQKEKLHLTDEIEGEKGTYLEIDKEESLQTSESSAPHPFKGNFVDFSG